MTDNLLNKLKEWDKKVKECEARGHPYEQEVDVGYNGSNSMVLVTCKGCGFLYEREPTGKENMKMFLN